MEKIFLSLTMTLLTGGQSYLIMVALKLMNIDLQFYNAKILQAGLYYKLLFYFIIITFIFVTGLKDEKIPMSFKISHLWKKQKTKTLFLKKIIFLQTQ